MVRLIVPYFAAKNAILSVIFQAFFAAKYGTINRTV